ncbi:HEAT repeat domain-containing protein [Catellatospora coxensis]|nr:HEAT repeat domain-containing protein [Catellatospora coxensis]
MDQVLIDAIRAGDLATVRSRLSAMPQHDLWQDAGRVVAGEVVRSGGPGFAQLLYEGGEIVPSGPWAGTDPVLWAAEHGASELLEHLLSRYPAPEQTLSRALDAARTWLDVDPEAELRRRFVTADDGAVSVLRDHVCTGEYSPRALRIRLVAADGRRAEVLVGHRAVVTVLEQALGRAVSREDLLSRALWSADPESCDWSASRQALMRLPAEKTARWAVGHLDDQGVAARRFVAELLHYSTFAGEIADEPYAAVVLEALRSRMAAESDTEALCSVLGAYAGFSEIGAIMHEFLPFVTDHRPEVRGRVACELLNGVGGPADDPPQPILDTLLVLACDPDPEVRAAATSNFLRPGIDTPALREVLNVRMRDDERQMRVNAATCLAIRGDENALALLRGMGDEDGYLSHAWVQLDYAERALSRGHQT